MKRILRSKTCERIIFRNLPLARVFFFFLWNTKQKSAKSKTGLVLEEWDFFLKTQLNFEISFNREPKEEYLAESILLGIFAVWFFVVHRMKPSTIRAKIREMIRESDLGIPTHFKNVLLDSFFKGITICRIVDQR